MAAKIALVTGASRGIGKVCALELARAGYDVAVAARTLPEGEGEVTTPYADDLRKLAVAGSVEKTVEEIRVLGREALPLRLDLLDRKSIEAAFEQLIRTWGRIDVLVNNGAYQGPGLMYRFLELEVEQLETSVVANSVNQFHLTRLVLPTMIEQGGGAVFNMTSHAGMVPPPAPTGEGGWGYAHAAAQGAFHRMVGVLNVEHGRNGIRAYNLEPGFTKTEALATVLGNDDGGLDILNLAIEPQVTADVMAWLEAQDSEGRYCGDISTPTFFAENDISTTEN
ncbi:MAG: SDR family NAD(P)-dependent oxidoreductase [Halieaceae bacterium]|nr:SDR family NAD(P)-dependent oxidoreductase [Halieaceae bacterium]